MLDEEKPRVSLAMNERRQLGVGCERSRGELQSCGGGEDGAKAVTVAAPVVSCWGLGWLQGRGWDGGPMGAGGRKGLKGGDETYRWVMKSVEGSTG